MSAVGEETAFLRTIAAGSKMFEAEADEVKAAGRKVFGGNEAFVLHDTYGSRST